MSCHVNQVVLGAADITCLESAVPLRVQPTVDFPIGGPVTV